MNDSGDFCLNYLHDLNQIYRILCDVASVATDVYSNHCIIVVKNIQIRQKNIINKGGRHLQKFTPNNL